jgi:phosphoglycolate phosphatase-like HAD superfamily hydrolase
MDASARRENGATGLAWMFDIDGTLLTTEGAASEAFARAVADTFGITDDLDGVAFAGRVEPLILADILARHGLTLDPAAEARFWNAVFDHARALLVPPRGRLMPGVPRIVDRVAEQARWVPGLLTGNMTQMAAIKLRRFGLERRFAFGAFGEMARDRNALARLAVARVRDAYGLPGARCIVIGDTEHDIECARAAGAWAVAVATGSRPREVLAAHAPDLLLEDLADPAPLFEFAARIEAGETQPAGRSAARGALPGR